MQASFFSAADRKFGLQRKTGGRLDGKLRLMVLEMHGVESKEACEGVITLKRDFDEDAIALYRASYYDAVKEAAGIFDAETSHVKFVAEKLRKTHKATPTHWRLGMDVKLTIKVFDSRSERSAVMATHAQIPGYIGDFNILCDSPPLVVSFCLEHLLFFNADGSTFEESYLRDNCLISMSAEQILERQCPKAMRIMSSVQITEDELKESGGDISRVRQVYYNKRRPYFRDELEFEATLLGTLAKFLPSVSSSFHASVAGPMSFSVPFPYCLLARKDPCSFAQLVGKCKKELANQDGNHVAAMAAIFNQRSQLLSKALDLVDQEDINEIFVHAGYKPIYKEEKDKKLRQFKNFIRAKLEDSVCDVSEVLEATTDCFLVALLGAMEETFETVSPSEEKPQAAAAAAAAVAGEKRKAQEDPSVAESSCKQAKL